MESQTLSESLSFVFEFLPRSVTLEMFLILSPQLLLLLLESKQWLPSVRAIHVR